MGRYLVMRRTMTGSWEDELLPNGEAAISAESPEDAQAFVSDGLGVYRVIELQDYEVPTVSYVTVEHTIARSVVEEPPPLDEGGDVPFVRAGQSG